MDVNSLIIKKLESLEQKMDRNTTAFNDFQLKVQKETMDCKAELIDDINRVEVSIIKLSALVAGGGTVGSVITHIISKFS